MPLRYLSNVVTLAYEPEKCRGCGLCVEVCPHAVFQMNGGIAELGDKDLCIECGACQRNCPFEAIQVRSGVGCAWAILLSSIRGRKVASCE